MALPLLLSLLEPLGMPRNFIRKTVPPPRRAGQMRFTGPDGQWYRIRFQYYPACEDGTTVTACYIEDERYHNIVDYAYALQHPSDRFCKDTGRKIALKRALEHARWDRETRRRAWDAYHNRGKQ